MSRLVARNIVDSDARFGNFGTITLAMARMAAADALAQIDAVRSFGWVVDPRQVFGEPRVESRGLRWKSATRVSCAVWVTAASSEIGRCAT